MAASAAEVLERTVSVYASCKSYRDSGEAVMAFDHGKAPAGHEFRAPFATLFVRPAHFRYQLTIASFRRSALDERYVVWADGQGIRSWCSLRPAVAEQPSIPMALAGPTGVSFGSAYCIPYLLLPAPEQRSLPVSTTARVRAEASEEGERFVVSGPLLSGQESEVWIDAYTFLIHKVHTAYAERPMDPAERLKEYEEAAGVIESRSDLSPESKERILASIHPARNFRRDSKVTTTYSPEIDVEIPPGAFAFTPPA